MQPKLSQNDNIVNLAYNYNRSSAENMEQVKVVEQVTIDDILKEDPNEDSVTQLTQGKTQTMRTIGAENAAVYIDSKGYQLQDDDRYMSNSRSGRRAINISNNSGQIQNNMLQTYSSSHLKKTAAGPKPGLMLESQRSENEDQPVVLKPMSPTSKSLDKIGNHGRKNRQIAAYGSGFQSQPAIVGAMTINSSQ